VYIFCIYLWSILLVEENSLPREIHQATTSTLHYEPHRAGNHIVHVIIALIATFCLKMSRFVLGFFLHDLQSHSHSYLDSIPHFAIGWPLCNICVTNGNGYVPLVVNTSRSFSHSWLFTGFVTRLIRRLSLVGQEFLTLPSNLRSPPVFSFMYILCRSLFVLLCFFFWPLCCLSFFDLRILITPLVSSNSSSHLRQWMVRGKWSFK